MHQDLESRQQRPLLEHHRRLLEEESGIAADVIAERGYWTATTTSELAELGFSLVQRRVPALVLPKCSTAGVNGVHEIRPDSPRSQRRNGKERLLKYEVPLGSRSMIDVHPRTVAVLDDPEVMLLVGEGIRKGDSALSRGLHCLNLSGVSNYRGTNAKGGKLTLRDFDDIALNGRRTPIVYDSDGGTNPHVLQAAKGLQALLRRRGAKAPIVFLPPGLNSEKVGLDDFLVAGGDIDALIAEAERTESGIYVASARRYHLTDYGNAERLVAQHRDEIRYCRPADVWHVWNGTHWTDDGWALIERRAKETVRTIYRDVEFAASDDEAKAIVDHARKSEAAPRLSALVALARSEPGIPILPAEFDQDPLLLNVQNGTIDLRTGELRPYRRADMISKLVPLDYDPDARCPRWDAFLREVTNDRPELADFLCRAVGYSLTGDTRERALFIGYGGGKNGKTKFYETLAALLGPYAAHTPVQTLLAKRDHDRPGNELAALRGVRFVSASEPAEGARLDVALVKALTGQDPITARFLFREFFTYTPEFKLWLMTNHRPIIRETQDAIWDRVKLIPFDVRFYAAGEDAPRGAPRQDPTLSDVLRGELPGILAWAVRGCLEWQRYGLGEPEAVRAATHAYRTEQDAIGAFLDEVCVRDEQAFTPSDALYMAYTAWFEDSGEPKSTKLSKKMLGTRLSEHGFVQGRTRGRPQVRAWFGIGLRSDDDPSAPETRETTPESGPDEPVDTCAPETHVDTYSGKSPHTSAYKEKIPENGSTRVYGHNVSTPYDLLTTDAQLAATLPDLLAADILGLDVETTGLNPRADRLNLVQLATRERVVLIDAATVDLTPLSSVLAGSAVLVGHNLSFDLGFLQAAGLPIPDGDRLFDTMLASQVLDGGAHPIGATVPDPSGGTSRAGQPAKLGYHTLAALAQRTLGVVVPKEQQGSDWDGPLTDEQLAYAARDAAVLLPFRDALEEALAAEELRGVAALEFSTLPAVVWLETSGVPLDVAAWTTLRDEAAVTLATIDAELVTVLPGVNVDSPTQLIGALADRGMTIPNVQEATLRTVADQHPAIGLVLQRKEAKKRVSTYGDTYLCHVHPATGRIHANYRQIGAASGRMACSQPNLQNIPRDAAYRRCIGPPAGRVLVKADYSQIELRIAAQISGDAAMQAAFRAGDDLHTKTARAVLRREPTAHDRQLAKALNFGLLYGMGSERLRAYARDDYGVTLSEEAAVQFRQRFFQTYPGLKAWHRAQRDGEVTTRTLAGRPRHRVSQFTEKLNSPVQGTGADILKGALARLWADRDAVPSAAPVLAVHDEIVVEVDRGEADTCARWLADHMEAAGAAVLTDVPVVVETQIVADWSGTPLDLTRDDVGG
jgi:P4 family phage/plasmid primase-like protien